jgi:hypothetical protein
VSTPENPFTFPSQILDFTENIFKISIHKFIQPHGIHLPQRPDLAARPGRHSHQRGPADPPGREPAHGVARAGAAGAQRARCARWARRARSATCCRARWRRGRRHPHPARQHRRRARALWRMVPLVGGGFWVDEADGVSERTTACPGSCPTCGPRASWAATLPTPPRSATAPTRATGPTTMLRALACRRRPAGQPHGGRCLARSAFTPCRSAWHGQPRPTTTRCWPAGALQGTAARVVGRGRAAQVLLRDPGRSVIVKFSSARRQPGRPAHPRSAAVRAPGAAGAGRRRACPPRARRYSSVRAACFWSPSALTAARPGAQKGPATVQRRRGASAWCRCWCTTRSTWAKWTTGPPPPSACRRAACSPETDARTLRLLEAYGG